MPADTWQDRHARLCERFAQAAAEPDCPWDRWRDLWTDAERCWADALGRKPRRPRREAWRTRHSLGAMLRPKAGGPGEGDTGCLTRH